MEELIPIVLFISIAAVAIFRPLTKRIGLLIEQAYNERKAVQSPQSDRVEHLMERVIDRMDRLEDRVDFTERMLDSRKSLSAPAEHPRMEGREAEKSKRRI